MLSTANMRGKAGEPGVRKPKPRYVGPFEVLHMVGEVAVKLSLPKEWSRIHPVFHVSLVKPYLRELRQVVAPPPVQWLDGEPLYTVEKLLSHRLTGCAHKPRLEILERWRGYIEADDTWELRTNLLTCDELVQEYAQQHNLQVA